MHCVVVHRSVWLCVRATRMVNGFRVVSVSHCHVREGGLHCVVVYMYGSVWLCVRATRMVNGCVSVEPDSNEDGRRQPSHTQQ